MFEYVRPSLPGSIVASDRELTCGSIFTSGAGLAFNEQFAPTATSAIDPRVRIECELRKNLMRSPVPRGGRSRRDNLQHTTRIAEDTQVRKCNRLVPSAVSARGCRLSTNRDARPRPPRAGSEPKIL